MDDHVPQSVEGFVVDMLLILQERFQHRIVEDISGPHTQARDQFVAVSNSSCKHALLIGWVTVTWILLFFSVWGRFENARWIPQERIQAAHRRGDLACLRFQADRGGCQSFTAGMDCCVAQKVEATYCGV